jgi:predicted nucleic acid-binding protein
MSGDETFFDTNILLYLLSDDEAKADKAEELLGAGGVVSVQVLDELTAAAIRKPSMPIADVREVLRTIRAICRVDSLTVETHDKGLEISERYRFSLYDSMIVASALLAKCTTLYSEDLNHHQRIDDQLTIINPFEVAR